MDMVVPKRRLTFGDMIDRWVYDWSSQIAKKYGPMKCQDFFMIESRHQERGTFISLTMTCAYIAARQKYKNENKEVSTMERNFLEAYGMHKMLNVLDTRNSEEHKMNCVDCLRTKVRRQDKELKILRSMFKRHE
jgi:hypothetical protein